MKPLPGKLDQGVKSGLLHLDAQCTSAAQCDSSDPLNAVAQSGMEDTFWTGPEPQSVMPRRRSFPALGISALWKALPSGGQQPAQKAPYPPLPLSRAL